MNTRHNVIARASAAAAALLLTFALAVPAFADSTTGTAEVTGGSLSLDSATSFALTGITLDGTDKTTSGSFAIDLKDLTGTGTGWHVTIATTPFTTTNGVVTDTLTNTAAYISNVAMICDNPGTQTCTNPTNNITVDDSTNRLILDGTETLYNAAANTGMGDFTLTPTFKLNLPADAYAGTYQSTLTVSVISGP
jgi:hypothetical protein